MRFRRGRRRYIRGRRGARRRYGRRGRMRLRGLRIGYRM